MMPFERGMGPVPMSPGLDELGVEPAVGISPPWWSVVGASGASSTPPGSRVGSGEATPRPVSPSDIGTPSSSDWVFAEKPVFDDGVEGVGAANGQSDEGNNPEKKQRSKSASSSPSRTSRGYFARPPPLGPEPSPIKGPDAEEASDDDKPTAIPIVAQGGLLSGSPRAALLAMVRRFGNRPEYEPPSSGDARASPGTTSPKPSPKSSPKPSPELNRRKVSGVAPSASKPSPPTPRAGRGPYTAASVPRMAVKTPVSGTPGSASPVTVDGATPDAMDTPSREASIVSSFFSSFFSSPRKPSGEGRGEDPPRSMEDLMKRRSAKLASTRSRGASDQEAWEDQASDSLMALGMKPWVMASKLTESTVVTGVPKEDLADVAWWEKNLPDPESVAPPSMWEIRRLARRAKSISVPCVLRGKVWLHASGGARYRLKNPLEFEQVCAALSEGGEGVAYRHMASDVGTQLCLNQDGTFKAQRVLACVAYTYPEVQLYCPWLPLIVHACLHWLDERDSYAVACALNREPSDLIKTRVTSWLMLIAFTALAQRETPGEFAALCDHVGVENPPRLDQDHPLAGIVYDWLKNIHFWPLMRILDIFIIEGTEIFYRMGIVVLQRWHQSVTYQPRLSSGFARKAPSWYLPSSAARAIEHPDKFITDCLAVRLTPSDIVLRHKRAQAHARAASEASGTILAVGESLESKEGALLGAQTALVIGSSDIIESQDQWNTLWREFPERYRVKPLQLIFSTEKDGYNLGTLFRLCDEECPTLLLIETTKKERFGAFLTNPWTERYRHSHYFGNGDSFIFELTGGATQVFSWVGLADGSDGSDSEDADEVEEIEDADGDDESADGSSLPVKVGGIPSFFMMANDHMIAVGGGGGHAIQLDAELRHGYSQPCTTFGNPSLLDRGDSFTCVRVEVWAFSAPRKMMSPTDVFGSRGVASMVTGLIATPHAAGE